MLLARNEGMSFTFAAIHTGNTMKLISLSEAQQKLNGYGQLCQQESVIVHIDGVPQFQLAPLDDGFMDQLIETNQEFRELMAQRRTQSAVPLAEAMKQLDD